MTRERGSLGRISRAAFVGALIGAMTVACGLTAWWEPSRDDIVQQILPTAGPCNFCASGE